VDLSGLAELLAANGAHGAKAVESFLTREASGIVALAKRTVEAQLRGGKVLVLGNGGSAADAQHLAAELVGRYLLEREPLAALALTVDTSVLTCLGNDYGFQAVFARQVRAHGKAGDIVIALSTSGKSENVLEALKAARAVGCVTVGLTGEGACEMERFCDVVFKAPTGATPRIQECHMAWVHAYCEAVEIIFVGERSP